MKKTILNIGIAAWISMQTISMNAQTYSCNTATTANWQSLGPTTVPTGGGGVGLALTMACHPTDANILYSSGIGGGMWKTVNKGTSWTKLESNQGYFDQSHIGQIAISKSFPNTMYASTGNAAGFSGGGFGMNNLSTGVYKSTNGGTTWTPTGLTGVSTGTNKTWNFGLNNTNYSHVAKLVVHPTNPNIVFAAVITRASWNDVLDTKQGALYKTSDGGITWVQVIGLTNAPSPSVAGIISTYMVDVEFHPTNADIVYASGHRLFKSIDGGTAWTDISNTLPGLQPPMHHVSTLEIAVSPAAPNLLRIAQNTPVNNSRKFLLWSYSHSTHTATKTTEFAGSRYNLVVDPVNASKIYTGTIEYGKPVYRSLDAGLTWALMCTTCTNDPSIHTDIRDIAINPLDGYIYICTDGGISSSPNNEEPAINSWSFKGNGMAITNAGGFDVAQTDGRILLATDHNRLMVYEPSTNTWRANNNTGDGNGAIIDAANSNIMYASDGFNQIILKSTDAFAQDQNSINFAGANNEYGIGSIAAHPNNSNTIYIGKADLWKSTNFGDAPRIKLSNFGNAGLISMIAISPANDNIMYVFDGWNLKRTQDGGLTWSITGKNIFPAYQSFPVQTYEGGVTGGTIITENIAYTDITSITAHPTD
ncbi:MAG TPA: hypothetical protein VL947_01255, partial [Cytophagales bacterium]|nr:hypothetical protein [Cytophagales bacterium]